MTDDRLKLVDRAIVRRLIGNINELKHSLTCGSTLTYSLWKRLGCIEMMFDMLEPYTNRLQLRARPNVNDVEQTLKRLDVDGDKTPYMVVRGAILALEAMHRTAQAVEKLVAPDTE